MAFLSTVLQYSKPKITLALLFITCLRLIPHYITMFYRLGGPGSCAPPLSYAYGVCVCVCVRVCVRVCACVLVCMCLQMDVCEHTYMSLCGITCSYTVATYMDICMHN